MRVTELLWQRHRSMPSTRLRRRGSPGRVMPCCRSGWSGPPHISGGSLRPFPRAGGRAPTSIECPLWFSSLNPFIGVAEGAPASGVSLVRGQGICAPIWVRAAFLLGYAFIDHVVLAVDRAAVSKNHAREPGSWRQRQACDDVSHSTWAPVAALVHYRHPRRHKQLGVTKINGHYVTSNGWLDQFGRRPAGEHDKVKGFAVGASVHYAFGATCTPDGIIQTSSWFVGDGEPDTSGPWDVERDEFRYDPKRGHFDLVSATTTQLNWPEDQDAIPPGCSFHCGTISSDFYC